MTRATTQRVVGWVLVAPALLALLVSYVEPTFWTVRASVRGLDVLTGTAQGPGGIDSYREALAGGYWRDLGFALSLAVVPLLVALVVAPLLAYAAARAGRAGRTATRVVLAVPLALYAPVGVAAAWKLSADPPDPDRTGVRTLAWLASAGLVCALATTAYLAALRADTPPARRRAMLVTGGVATLATIAVVVQAFAYPIVLGVGGTGPETVDTPVVAGYLEYFGLLQGGPGTAISVLNLGLLALLGLGAAALLIAARARLTVEARASGPPAARSAAATAGLAIGLLGILAVVIFSHRPWFAGLGEFGSDSVRTLTVTWLPPFVSSLVGVLLAAFAAFGIGALRPLGRWSELLLLPFAPWLFVGPGPLAPRAYHTYADLSLLGETWSLVPPGGRPAIPALFLLTLLFAGLTATRRPVASLAPALPMIGLAFVGTWIVAAGDLLWPLVTVSAVSPDRWPAPLAVFAAVRDEGAGAAPIGLTGPLPVLLLLLALAVAAQLLYLDRLALKVGARETIGG